MGKIYDAQARLKTAIEALSEFALCTVLIKKDHNISMEANKAMGHAKGFTCIIGAPSGRAVDAELDRPRLKIVMGLQITLKPSIAEHPTTTGSGEPLDVMEALAVGVQAIEPFDMVSRTMCREWRFLGFREITNLEMAVVVCEVETIIQL